MATRVLVSLLAGVALALAFEPTGLVLLLPLSLAVFAADGRGSSAARGAGLGYAFGFAFMFTLCAWLRVVGWDALLALTAFMALYFALLGAGTAVVSRLRSWPVWAAVLWVGIEVFRGAWPFGGLPWGRLAFATADTPFTHWLPWLGTNGAGFVLALLGTTLGWALLHIRSRPVVAGLGVAAALGLAVLPAVRPYQPHVDPGTVRVAAVQGNVPGNGDDILLNHRQVTANHVEATVRLAERVKRGEVEAPDFVVWPENSTAVDPFTDGGANAGIEAASAAIGVPILVGAMVNAPDEAKVLNQGIVWDPRTGAGYRYTKRHPVPYGETSPYRERVDPSRNFGRLALIPRDMLSGTRTEPLRIDGVEIADAICFDVAYDDAIFEQVRAGAGLLVVQTSNAMFIHTGQIQQQFEISRLRAIETGRYVVVAATNGVSGIIRPDGTPVAKAAIRTQEVLLDDLTVNTRPTPAVLIGPWLGYAAVAVSLGSIALALVPYRRTNIRVEETVPAQHEVPA